MTLRLASSPPTIQQYMERLTGDTSLSLEQKSGVVKTLITVLRNLEQKGTDIKYRKLNLSNETLRTRLFCFPDAESLLTELVGFSKIDNQELILSEPPSSFLLTRVSQEWFPVLSSTQTTLASMSILNDNGNDPTAKKAKLTKSSSSVSASSSSSTLSEKQKARRLLEEKKEQEKRDAKLAREKTRAQIAADKRVRLEDENWKPSVCSAAAKGGTKLQTFRDRHGE